MAKVGEKMRTERRVCFIEEISPKGTPIYWPQSHEAEAVCKILGYDSEQMIDEKKMDKISDLMDTLDVEFKIYEDQK